jgi:hypothetical protein
MITVDISVIQEEKKKTSSPLIEFISSDNSPAQQESESVIEKKQPDKKLTPKIDKELSFLFTDRAKLSNYYHVLIKEKASKDQFKIHYERIEEITEKIKNLWIKKDHFEKYGSLPDLKKLPDSPNIDKLKNELRSLNNIKSKEKAKLKNIIKFPEGSAKRTQKENKISEIELKQMEIKKQIQKLEND